MQLMVSQPVLTQNDDGSVEWSVFFKIGDAESVIVSLKDALDFAENIVWGAAEITRKLALKGMQVPVKNPILQTYVTE